MIPAEQKEWISAEMHRIRLREPWQAAWTEGAVGTRFALYSRRFNRPTGLDKDQSVRLCLSLGGRAVDGRIEESRSFQASHGKVEQPHGEVPSTAPSSPYRSTLLEREAQAQPHEPVAEVVLDDNLRATLNGNRLVFQRRECSSPEHCVFHASIAEFLLPFNQLELRLAESLLQRIFDSRQAVPDGWRSLPLPPSLPQIASVELLIG